MQQSLPLATSALSTDFDALLDIKSEGYGPPKCDVLQGTLHWDPYSRNQSQTFVSHEVVSERYINGESRS